MSGPGGLCVEARRFAYRGPALFVSWPGVLCSGPGGLGPALYMSGRRGPMICVSGPGALLCVGARRSLDRRPALCVRGPAVFVSGSGMGPAALFVSGPSAPVRPSSIRTPAPILQLQGPSSDRAHPSACHPSGIAGPELRAACHPSGPGGPQLESACHVSSPAHSPFCRREPEPYYLGEK